MEQIDLVSHIECYIRLNSVTSLVDGITELRGLEMSNQDIIKEFYDVGLECFDEDVAWDVERTVTDILDGTVKGY